MLELTNYNIVFMKKITQLVRLIFCETHTYSMIDLLKSFLFSKKEKETFKHRESLKFKKFFVCLFMLMSISQSISQTTINTNLAGTTSTGSGGNGITFGIENTNTGAQVLTDVGYYLTSSHSNTVYELWVSSTSLSGPQPTAYPSVGWTLVATATTGTITGTGSIQPIFTGLTYIIPGNTTLRFAL